MIENQNDKKDMLLMVVCALLWSMGGIFIKLISWNPLFIAGARALFSTAVIGAYMLYKKIPIKINRYSVWAGIGLSVSCLLFVAANKLTTAANAIVLQYTAPVFILLMSVIFFKEKIHGTHIFAVGGTMIGIVLFFFDQLSPGNILGNIFAILAGIFLALMFVMVGRGGGDDSTRFSGVFLAHAMTCVFGMIPGGFMLDTAILPKEILFVIILGVFQMGLSYVLYGIASKNCTPLACSLIGMLEPLLNPVWVMIFAGEVPGMFALIGAVIIIAVVTWWCIRGEKA